MFHPSTQKVSETDRKSHFLSLAIIGFVLCLGLWLVVIKPLGPGLSLIPGDLGDSRFNEVILEHFYRWASGLDKSYWDARFFYPFPLTTAFSDNLLGSAPFYAVFRWAGTDRETALQVWYIFGYVLNFIASTYVLYRSRFSSWAVAVGAFFFTFGLPLLAQEGHFQLLYRFGVPLAGYFLWAWAQEPTFKNLGFLVFFVVFQFFLTIYTGFFLLILLCITALLIPFAFWVRSVRDYSLFWPRRVKQTWLGAERHSRIFWPLLITALLIAGIELFLPYYKVTHLYGFTRDWTEMTQMMPRPRSYFLADRSLIWKPISIRIGDIEMRGEHQLFPGIAVFLTVILGILWRFHSENRKVAFLYLAVFLLSVAGTLEFRGHSLYELIWWLPGINSIRAVTRIQLVMMWPLAFFIAYTFDALLYASGQGKFLKFLAALLLFTLMISESVLFDHYTFSKQETQNRLARLFGQQLAKLPAQPILFVAAGSHEPFWASEIDGMLLAQQHNWDTLNGYSGNFPPGYEPANSCAAIPKRIINYLNFAHQSNQATYLNLIHRVVPIGFSGCDPEWWKEIPGLTKFKGAIPSELLSKITIEGISISKYDQTLIGRITIKNNSSQSLPADSTTGNSFRLLYLPLNMVTGQPMLDYEFRQKLDFDLKPHNGTVITVTIEIPKEPGRYLIVARPIQQGITPLPENVEGQKASEQSFVVDESGAITVIEPSPQ